MSNEGDFESNSDMVPIVKDAWLKYKFANQSIYLGMSATPTFALIEDTWGYRSVEKVSVDLYKMGSSKDFGIAGKGSFDREGIFNYHLMFSSGNGNKQEIDKGKSGQLSLYWSPSEAFIFETFGEYADAEGIEDGYTWRLFGAYMKERFRIGIEYANQTLKQASTPDIKRRFLSVFVSGKIIENFSLILRGDRMFDPNPDGGKIAYLPFDPDAPSTFFLAAVEWTPVKGVCITPNLEYVRYDKSDEDTRPGDDLYGRVTFYWQFK